MGGAGSEESREERFLSQHKLKAPDPEKNQGRLIRSQHITPFFCILQIYIHIYILHMYVERRESQRKTFY